MHPRHFGPDNITHPYIHPFMLADVKCHTYQLGVKANKYIDLARAKSDAPVCTFLINLLQTMDFKPLQRNSQIYT